MSHYSEYSEPPQPEVSRPILYIACAIAFYMSTSMAMDVAAPILEARKTPEGEANYYLNQQNVRIDKIGLGFLDNRAKFEPYRRACKAAANQTIKDNCGRIAFMLNS